LVEGKLVEKVNCMAVGAKGRVVTSQKDPKENTPLAHTFVSNICSADVAGKTTSLARASAKLGNPVIVGLIGITTNS
jgi:hypothetical protein